MAKEFSSGPVTDDIMGWENQSYNVFYSQKLETYKSQNPGDVMVVVLNEEAPVASKRQFCAKVPAYKPEEEAKYSARSPNDFLRLEELALLYPVPSTSKDQHYPAVHPDIRRRLQKLGNTLAFNIPGLKESDTDGWDPLVPEYGTILGSEHETVDEIQERSEEISDAAIWYVGRAIDQGQDLPYEHRNEGDENNSVDDDRGYGDINYFSLRAFIFSHIAPYYTPSSNAELVLDEDDPGLGITGNRTYEISGSFESPSSELKTPEELNRDGIETQSDVKEALKSHVEDLLLSLFRIGMFSPGEVEETDPDQVTAKNDISVGEGDGNGRFQPPSLLGNKNIDDINISTQEPRENKQDTTNEEDIEFTIDQLVDRLDSSAELTEHGVSFHLKYLP